MLMTTERAWDTFHVQLKRFILKYIHDEVVAEDILQDVFVFKSGSVCIFFCYFQSIKVKMKERK